MMGEGRKKNLHFGKFSPFPPIPFQSHGFLRLYNNVLTIGNRWPQDPLPVFWLGVLRPASSRWRNDRGIGRGQERPGQLSRVSSCAWVERAGRSREAWEQHPHPWLELVMNVSCPWPPSFSSNPDVPADPFYLCFLCRVYPSLPLCEHLGYFVNLRFGENHGSQCIFRGNALARVDDLGLASPPTVVLSAQVPGVTAARGHRVVFWHTPGQVSWFSPMDVTLCLESSSRVWKGSYDQVKTLIMLFIRNVDEL